MNRADDTVRRSFGGRRGPATTLTLVTLIWPRGYIVHVGDSRAYYLHNGKLRQITRDQTMGDLFVDEGVMSEGEVEKAGLRNVLSSALGADMSPSVGLIDFEPDDVLLLCTDGLTKHVPDQAIHEALSRRETAEATCRGLVQGALAGGGSDNVSVIVARMPGA